MKMKEYAIEPTAGIYIQLKWVLEIRDYIRDHIRGIQQITKTRDSILIRTVDIFQRIDQAQPKRQLSMNIHQTLERLIGAIEKVDARMGNIERKQMNRWGPGIQGMKMINVIVKITKQIIIKKADGK